MPYFTVLALDLDGTLTVDDRPSAEALDAVRAARASGVTVLLATGRIQAELEADHPGLADCFDALVLENGAVVATAGRVRPVAPPLDAALAEVLSRRQIPFRRGRVLLAVDGTWAGAVVEAVSELGLDHQVVHNRAAAMVLPAGVTKGTGLVAALADLHLSARNAIAVGDAENDLALLDAAEVGVAVANSVPSLLRRADLVLDRGPGNGLVALASGPLLTGQGAFCPPRRWVPIGAFDDDRVVRVPGSQATVLVSGEPCSGKSYLTGLIAEQWILAGYTVLVVDPEGDHPVLADLPGVQLMEASARVPEPFEVLTTVTRPLTSVVLDLSALTEAARADYVRRLLPAVEAVRAAHGTPHWVVLDEAHLGQLPAASPALPRPLAGPGYLLASYLPHQFESSASAARLSPPVVLVAQRPEPALGALAPRRATISIDGQQERSFTVAPRRTAHVRHEHKYVTQPLPAHRKFYFHTTSGPPLVAGTITEFRAALNRCEPDVLAFHLHRGDMSRWVTETLADVELGGRLARIEQSLAEERARSIERARRDMSRAVTDRYLHDSVPS